MQHDSQIDLDKSFRSFAPGYWADQGVTNEEWNDHKWQLKNRITSLSQLEEHLNLSEDERNGVILSGTKLAMSITPHFFNLIDRNDPDCPIRRQVIPRVEETITSPYELSDPCGEDSNMPVPGLVHRYPDSVLFLVTYRCASYCRYCTSSRVVGGAGDPLLFSDSKLEQILSRLRSIKHIEFLRIGSRIPVFLPQRITPELCRMLQKYHPLFMSVHVNHPRELTSEVKEGLERLANHGIPLGNQSVLLRGVNDNVETMKALTHKLLMCRVRPYYLYQLDLIQGSSHLQVPVAKGLEIIEGLRGHTTGYSIPQYVIDAPGGGGKVPINPDYIVQRNSERVVIRNFEGKTFEYPEPAVQPDPLLDY